MNIKSFGIGSSYGLTNSENDVLYQFISGCSNVKLIVYLCGCFLYKEKFNELNRLEDNIVNVYFP